MIVRLVGSTTALIYIHSYTLLGKTLKNGRRLLANANFKSQAPKSLLWPMKLDGGIQRALDLRMISPPKVLHAPPSGPTCELDVFSQPQLHIIRLR